MPRTVRYWLAVTGATAALMLAGWPGPAANPATLINRVSVLAVAGILAGMPLLVRRRFGLTARGWAPAFARVVGCGTVVALLAVKAKVERVEFAAGTGRPSLAGLWAGEVIFLAVIAGYVAGLLIVTSRRTPASRATLLIGTGAGVGIGVAVYGLRPLDDKIHVTNGVLAVLYEAGKVLAVPLVVAAAIVASTAAARRVSSRASGRTGGQTLRDMRARQGFAAGACVGFVAAVVVSLLGIATIALLPHAAPGLQWTLPGRAASPGTLYAFEASLTDAGAGYLLVLIAFPVLGAGLGAWAGLIAGDSGLRPGGGGGGGPGRPGPEPRPPDGGRHAPAPPELTAAELTRLLSRADWRVIARPQDRPRAPAQQPEPERVPAGVP